MYKYADPADAYRMAKRYILNNALRRNQKSIDLSGFGLTEVPNDINKLRNIELIDLSNNKISELPFGLSNLVSLEVLRLNENYISTLPEDFGQIPQLRVIDLNDNKFDHFPPGLLTIKTLRQISMNNNSITEIPVGIGSIEQLEALLLDHNAIDSISDDISHLKNLISLRLHSNRLSEIPDAILHIPNLRELQLSYNTISTIPDDIALLGRLTSLAIANNKITEVPDSLFGLSNLKQLYLSGNPLYSIPDSIGNCHKLSYITLSSCRIRSMPDSLSELENLEYIFLANNDISEIPEGISKLRRLRYLDISDNRIRDLPPEIGDMRSLSPTAEVRKSFPAGMRFDGNPMSGPLETISLLVEPERTKTVLSWLRGELTPEDLDKILADFGIFDTTNANQAIDPENAPVEPTLEAGPTFTVTDGKIDVIPILDDLSASADKLQQSLLSRLRSQVEKLKSETNKVNNKYPELSQTVDDYENIISNQIDEIDIVELWAVGNALMAQAASFNGQNAARTLSDPLEPIHKSILTNVASLHGGFILGFPTGALLTERADRAQIAPEISDTIGGPTGKVLSAIAGRQDPQSHKTDHLKDVVSYKTRHLTASLEAALIVAGWKSARVGHSSYVTVRNFLTEAGRLVLLVNDKGGGVFGAAALAAIGFDSQAAISIVNFLQQNTAEIFAFASPFPELRTWFNWVMNHISREL